MPILIKARTYRWLNKLGVLKQSPTPYPEAPTLCQISFEEETYLRNGYLISVILKKFVEMYGEEYQELLKVRKIATLKQSQNWQIIEQHLKRQGCEVLEKEDEEKDGDSSITETDIQQILQFLMQKYGPQEQAHKNKGYGRKNFLDFNNFNPEKPLGQSENSLELICILLATSFEIPIEETLGLLVDKSRYLKKLMVDGSTKTDYSQVQTFVEAMIENWDFINTHFITNQKQMEYILEGVSEGVLSENQHISNLTLCLFGMIDCPEWFHKVGYMKLLRSSRIQCFNFVVEKVKPAYQLIFNEQLHEKVPDKAQLFLILKNLMNILPRTIYTRDILTHIPFSYFYEQVFSVLNPQFIDSQSPGIVVVGRELLATLIGSFPDKIPSHFLPKIWQLFQYQTRLYWDQYHIICQLFQILQALMEKENHLIAHFFKITMKYFQNTYGEARHWIIDNFRYLYQKHPDYFALGCFLKMYSSDPVCQPDEFQIFDLISNDRSELHEDQVEAALKIISIYVQQQIHGKCFIRIVHKFLKNHGKLATKWAEQTYNRSMSRLEVIKIPMLSDEAHIINPVPPNKNKVLQSIGMKRKQMLKFREYQLLKQVLYNLVNLKDKKFLEAYHHYVSVHLSRLQHEIGVKKKALIEEYKKLKVKIKKNSEALIQSPTMNQLVKSILVSRSMVAETPREQPLKLESNQMNDSSNSMWEIAQSRITNTDYHPIIEEENSDNQNQFLNQKISEKNEQVQHLPEQTEENMLLPFTETNSEFIGDSPFFYTPQHLEQHEISYIKMVKQKYDNVVCACTRIYQSIAQDQKQLDVILNKFLKAIKLQNMVQIADAEELFMKCRLLQTNTHDVISNFLVQLAFRLFGFKENRRIFVVCAQSMFLYLGDAIREILKEKQQNPKKTYSVSQNIQYDYALSRQILPSPDTKAEAHFVCFNTLSEIFMDMMGFNLIEPLSKQVSHYQSPQHLKISDELEDFPEDDFQDKEQIIQQPPSHKKTRAKKAWVKKQAPAEVPTEQKKGHKFLDNGMLRSRISERRKALQRQIQQKKQSMPEINQVENNS